MYFVYLIECADGSLYTGIAKDVRKRLRMHEAGKGAKYTRGRGPLRLVYVELQLNKSEALKRERAVKRLPTKEKWKLAESVCLWPRL
jgi:putative endonuclease